MENIPDWAAFEADRLKSFKRWPFKKGPCNPVQMAEAGFYFIGSKSEPDLARCYVCCKELDGWEEHDNPWLEHKKHAPKCPYVLLDKKPADLTVKDMYTLEAERMKRVLVMRHEAQVKTLNEIKACVLEELDKLTNKGGKDNRKRSTRPASKRSSRKD
ncbi:baculoviral IAP repeat-containing protein 5-like [Thrips palmi]|uniref:Baculoviral IAP repeat-containing protein 5-like n=1 Tax=Thrips palmi TaxID=161013 RepID=A0A6P8ZS52_THRPL|nr:baculoviral IAP repeat-containing protein 5-like [Thrips palmi]